VEQQSNRLDYERKRYEVEIEEFDQTRRAQHQATQKLAQRTDLLTSQAEQLDEREAELERRTQKLEDLLREAQATRATLKAYEEELEQRSDRLQHTAQEQAERAQELNALSEALDDRSQQESEYFTSFGGVRPPDDTQGWDPHYTRATVYVVEPENEADVVFAYTSAPRPLNTPQDDGTSHTLDELNDTEVDLPVLSEVDLYLSSDLTQDLPTVKTAGEVITDEIEGLPLPLIYCPPGRFIMGSDQGEPGERPRHQVELSEGFLLGQTPITQRQWAQVMGSTPSRFVGLDRPVERISWSDAVIFCNRMSITCGLTPVYHVLPDSRYRLTVQVDFTASGFRLPTESEWEYAARANQTLHFAGAQRARDVAWTNRNSSKQSQPVAQKKPNSWNIFDLSGNIGEWCADVAVSYEQRPHFTRDPFYDAPLGYRIIRGGSWACTSHLCRVSSRGSAPPEARGPDMGLRVLRRSP